MLKNITNKFSIDAVGYPLFQAFGDKFVFEGEYHYYCEMVSIIGGKVEIVEDEKVYILSAGDIIIHAPMEFHKIKAVENSSPKIYNLSFTWHGNLPDNIFDGVFTLDFSQRDEFISIHKAASDFLSDNSDVYSSQLLNLKLSAFIIDICKNNMLTNVLSSSMGAITYNKVINSMYNEIYNNISLEELAKMNSISVSYLKSLFAKYAGISPKNYFRRLRANEAAKLLKDGLAVYEVSEKMNFPSPNHLTVFFKSVFGITPGKYKRQFHS